MPFRYYEKLKPWQKEIYLKSDSITSLPIAEPEGLFPLIKGLEDSLKKEDRLSIERFSQAIVRALSERFHVSLIKVKVLQVRPSNHYGELHGLYYPKRGSGMALMILWIRTAKFGRIVAFKTFLRTLLHEFCHHLDYELFNLPESFHTEGFYKRESHLLHQLMKY